MEELMSKARFVCLALAGLVLAAPFTCRPFAATDPYTSFIAGVGNQAISQGVSAGLANTNDTIADLLQTPLTNLYQSLWTGWVDYTFPRHPTYGTLLVQ
jgi:hypothetical protein